ncbi:MAG TPA: transglycosylase SLT domain-containing protein [Bacteroidales bacterium]|jgi:membrane-bound lytic murein transglycosylase D|nr:transglycosylase SLT domain-containing protein [Bacteroidales bacterium]
MMRIKLFVAVFSLMVLVSNTLSAVGDTIIIRSDISTEKISADLDSLVNSWYVRTALASWSELPPGDAGEEIMFSDSVYVDRLSKLNTIIKIRYNSIIRNHIHVYTVKKRELFSAILGLMDYYFPMIEDIFDSYGIPTELKYMAIIESALNPNAVSRAGATGLWQFMYSTGRLYGLTINSVVDERRDPVKATHAAARYLKDLYNIYNDWILVIAAYNCGPGNVNKAIRRSDNRKDYWEIYYRLPRETRGYIPGYVAAAYSVNYYEEHNIRPLPLNFPVATDTIMINKDMHLTQISEVMKIPEGELRALNPQYRTGLVPGLTKPMPITLPLSHLSDFIGLNDTIRGYKAEIYLNKNISVADPVRSATAYTPPDVKGKTKLVYTVKEGDNLGYISEWYRVGLSDLRYWNNIYRNTIRIGQKLSVFVDPAKADFYARVDNMSFAEKQAMIGKSVPLQPQSSQPYTGGGSDGEYITYTVRNGDTIWNIVKKFDSVTISDILSLNNITDPQKIQVGQVLKIKKKS